MGRFFCWLLINKKKANMQSIETMKGLIESEIAITNDSIDKIHKRIGGAFLIGSNRLIEHIANEFNSQLRRLELLRILLTQETVSDEALELIRRGTLTQIELETFLDTLRGS